MNVSNTLRIRIGALVIAASLISFTAESSAEVATAEQRAACTPDAFRLCASHIPEHPGDHRLHEEEPGKSQPCLQGDVSEVSDKKAASSGAHASRSDRTSRLRNRGDPAALSLN